MRNAEPVSPFLQGKGLPFQPVYMEKPLKLCKKHICRLSQGTGTFPKEMIKGNALTYLGKKFWRIKTEKFFSGMLFKELMNLVLGF